MDSVTRESLFGTAADRLSRRRALLQFACVTAAPLVLLGGCSRSDPPPPSAPSPPPPPPASPLPPPSPTPPVAPGPAPGTPLWRLHQALRNTPPLSIATDAITVTQGPALSADPSIGSDAVIYPAPRGFGVNPNPVNFATLPEVWGYRRDTWHTATAGYIGSSAGNDSWYVPLARWHRAATLSAFSAYGLHFVLEGRALEVLFAGTDVSITLVANGKLMTPEHIRTTLYDGVPSAALSAHNAYVRVDFGSSARREISLYAVSSQGPCAIAVGKQDRITPWDRSEEPSFCAVTDSYGQAKAVNWSLGGPFWEAASLLGIPHLDLNAMGGTGYAPNNANADTRDPGNSFLSRLPAAAESLPDLLLTAGGINDNNSVAALPLYATAEQAKAGFDAAVSAYFRDLRAALPNSVLAAMGPWAPLESLPFDPVARSKADTIRAALAAVAGPWVFLDNLNGTWSNSSHVVGPAAGRGWQTGTGNIGRPRGDGNGDLYVAADGVHPTPAGCRHLGAVVAAALRDAILAL